MFCLGGEVGILAGENGGELSDISGYKAGGVEGGREADVPDNVADAPSKCRMFSGECEDRAEDCGTDVAFFSENLFVGVSFAEKRDSGTKTPCVSFWETESEKLLSSSEMASTFGVPSDQGRNCWITS